MFETNALSVVGLTGLLIGGKMLVRSVQSKRWISIKGNTMGGLPFSRGALFHLLRNRIYLGKIVHKEQIYEGGHNSIVDADLFEKVQTHLDRKARRHRAKTTDKAVKAPLTGKVYDAMGEATSPTTSHGRSGGRYRYYVSASLQQSRAASSDQDILRRISAPEIERLVSEILGRWLARQTDKFVRLVAVRLREDGMIFEIGQISPA